MDMMIIRAVLLGLIQGLTEFLPISSSAHLEFFGWLFNWFNSAAEYDFTSKLVDLLNVGTLIAMCIYFFKDGIELIKCGFSNLIIKVSKKSKIELNVDQKQKGKMFWYFIAATIPTGILYMGLNKISEKIIGDNQSLHILLIAIASIIMGILLYVVDRVCLVKKSFEDLSLKDSLIIGISQAVAAVFPGVSRSGITISTSRTLRYDRATSAKVSFFLSIPLIAAGMLVKIIGFIKDIGFDSSYWLPFIVGNFVSFVVGYLAIKGFMTYLKKGKYSIFAIYRVGFGILLIVLLLVRGF